MRWSRVLYRVRFTIGKGAGLAATCAMLGLSAAGVFTDLPIARRGLIDLPHAAALAVLVGLVLGKVARVLRARPEPGRADGSLLRELDLGLALLAGTSAVVQMTGGGRSPLHPLVYLLATYVVAFHEVRTGLVVVLAAASLELVTAPTADLGLAFAHVGFLGVFGVVHVVFLRAELWRGRRERRTRLEGEIRAMREEARDFRLISSALPMESRVRTRAEEEEKLTQGAVETIHQSLFYTLELLKRSLDLHTAVLLWLDASGERLKIKELLTDSDLIVERDVPADAGAVGACVKDRLLINMRAPARGQLPYYREPEEVAAFACVPVLEDGHLRGVLAVDRLAGRPFDERDEALLQGAARQILRAIQSERVFAAVERSKYEKERFYRASELLNHALTLEQVYDVAVAAAREIVDFDFAAITLFAKESKKHTICRVEGAHKTELEGFSFADNAGLAAMVVKNKHYLPVSETREGLDVPVFTKRIKTLRGFPALLVLPLVCADEAQGSFTLASVRRGAFGKERRDMLGVIANQVAVSIENAKMYRLMEEMATTDGLTGLVNHRTFQERTDQTLERTARVGKRFALILCDIDHFKSINDTYGHPIGDVVLKRVAALLGASVRKIDVVARYGGEEFALVLEETDARGARELAERIRLEVERQTFSSGEKTFQVTLSLGVASYPDDSRDKHGLIERADQALYAAKHGGRNRVMLASEAAASEARQLRPAS